MSPASTPRSAKLVDADRGRGIATVVFALDDPEAMTAVGTAPVTDAADAERNKAAVDAVYRAYTPDYVMLLGSIDVIPHQPLRNPVYDGVNDVDRLAYGDLPYACNAPYSDDATDFIGPDRVVGRLADVTGASTPSVLVKLLGRAASWSSRPRSDYEAHLGITANVWQRSTVLSLRKLFAAAEVHGSPGEGPGWERALLRRRVHFINCHGAESEPRFFGQEGDNYPVSHESAQVAGRVSPGTIVAAECCYGGELWAPTADVLSMPMAYLANGAAGYWGASTIAYGPADANGDADLVCAYFVAAVLDGASIGRAALEARQRFVRGTTVLSPVNTKTLAQFNLLGDPSVHPVLPVAAPKGRVVGQARKGRRGRLLELAIANLRDTSVTREEDGAAPRWKGRSMRCWRASTRRSSSRSPTPSRWHRRRSPPSSRRRPRSSSMPTRASRSSWVERKPPTKPPRPVWSTSSQWRRAKRTARSSPVGCCTQSDRQRWGHGW